MNRFWKLFLCASLFMTMIFSSGLVNAEAKASDWSPAAGVYVRKNANGIPTGRIDVTVVKGFYDIPAVIVGVESRSYEGNTYEGSDMAPRIYIAGYMDVGQNSGEVILTNGYTDKRKPAPDPKILPLMTRVVYNATVNNKIITLTPQYFDGNKTRAMRTDPDLAGTYVFEGPNSSPSAFMAIAWVRQQKPKLSGLEPGRDYRYEDGYIDDVRKISYPGIQAIQPPIAPKEYFELKACDGNTLLRTFLVSTDFNQIYRIKPDGEAMLIFNNEGGVG